MGNKSIAEGKASAIVEEKKPEIGNAGGKEREFPYDVLKENARKLFGVSPSTFEGITDGMEGQKYTVSKMKAVIDTWLNKSAIKKEEQ